MTTVASNVCAAGLAADAVDSLTIGFPLQYDDMLHMGVKRGHARVIEAELRLPAPVEHQPVVVDSTQTPR